jgi:Family of unknown function (DUF6992)
MASNLPSFNLYRFQRQAMPILLGWATGSILIGALWRRDPSKYLRGIGGQFILWGLVDGVIALLALYGARRKAAAWQAGAITPQLQAREADQFEKIIWANVALDAGYVLGGRWWLRRHPIDPARRGTGVGVMIQGAFLLVWDILLVLAVGWRRRGA